MIPQRFLFRCSVCGKTFEEIRPGPSSKESHEFSRPYYPDLPEGWRWVGPELVCYDHTVVVNIYSGENLVKTVKNV